MKSPNIFGRNYSPRRTQRTRRAEFLFSQVDQTRPRQGKVLAFSDLGEKIPFFSPRPLASSAVNEIPEYFLDEIIHRGGRRERGEQNFFFLKCIKRGLAKGRSWRSATWEKKIRFFSPRPLASSAVNEIPEYFWTKLFTAEDAENAASRISFFSSGSNAASPREGPGVQRPGRKDSVLLSASSCVLRGE